MSKGGVLADVPKPDESLASAEEAYPRKFGPYLLLSAFAHGGMGEVYLAKSGGIEGIDRVCVLKKLRPDVAKNKEYLGRFIDEARVVVQLSHANIAHVFDVGAVGEEHYLAMEYVSGANAREIQLRASREEAHGLDAGLAAHIVSQVLDALDYAHRHKHPMTGQPLHLVHRDVSPQNVMVSFEGEVKLIDFGLAASDLKEEQTESQVVMGKVAYMSPEQARGDDVDAKTDQYAAAIVLYELLTGDRFYGDKNNYEIWQVVGRGGFVPRKFTNLDQEMTRILQRALAADAAQRYPSCGDFKDELDLYIREKHPQTSKRLLRELLERLFATDQQAEQRFLARYAEVSAAQARFVAPGKARSFVAQSDSASLSAEEAPPPDETAANPSLEPHLHTETGFSYPPESPVEDPKPEVSPERTTLVERKRAGASGGADSALETGDTGAAMREAYPASRRPVGMAAAVVVLLLAVVAFLLWPRGGGDPANPQDGDGLAHAAKDPAAEDPAATDPAVYADIGAPVEPGDAEEEPEAKQPEKARPTKRERSAREERAARRADKPEKRVRVAKAPAPAEHGDESAKEDPAKAAPPEGEEGADPDGKARMLREGDPDMAIHKKAIPPALHEKIRGRRWKNGLSDEQVISFIRECDQQGLLAKKADQLVADNLATPLDVSQGHLQLTSGVLRRCERASREGAAKSR